MNLTPRTQALRASGAMLGCAAQSTQNTHITPTSPSSRGPGHRPFTAVTRVRISVGTLPFRLISFGSFQPGSGSPEGLHAPPAWRADPGRRWPLPSSPSPSACIASSWSGPRDRPVPGSPCLRRRPSRRDPAVGDRWPAEVWPARSHRGLDARRRPAGSGRQLAELPRLRSGALPDDVGVILCRS